MKLKMKRCLMMDVYIYMYNVCMVVLGEYLDKSPQEL
jgi:hypothetical protein